MIARPVLTIVLIAAMCVLAGCGKPARAAVPKDVVEIINAIDVGDQARLRALLENGAVPTPDGSPLSPIHAAITHFSNGKLVCDTDAMRLLLDHGANPNFIDQYSGFAPLEGALFMGDMECIRLLRNAGASIDTHGKSGQSLMEFAVKGAERSGDVAILQLVTSWGISINVSSTGGRTFTALHQAAWINTPQIADSIVAELLRLGADPCIPASDGQTPLDMAINLKRSPKVQARLRSAMTACSQREQ